MASSTDPPKVDISWTVLKTGEVHVVATCTCCHLARERFVPTRSGIAHGVVIAVDALSSAGCPHIGH
jgi:hypothetical protein